MGEREEWFSSLRWVASHWQGIPTVQCPFDVWAIQQLIWTSRPRVIVETGTFCGGSALLWASLLRDARIAGSSVITVDSGDDPGGDTAKARERPLARRVEWVQGSSIDPAVIAEVHRLVAGRRALVILDSAHTTDHVLAELEAYSPLAQRWLIVQDTWGDHPSTADWEIVRARGHEGGAWAAVQQFLSAHEEWQADDLIEPPWTFAPGGWLRRSTL